MGSVQSAVSALGAAYEELAAADLDALSHRELIDVLDGVEHVVRRLPTQSHRVLARLQGEASPVALGAKNWCDVLATRLRISRAEARRRLAEASELGPRHSITGEPLEPVLAATAAAQARGDLGGEHVQVIRGFMGRLPGWVDAATRTQAEQTLVRVGVGLGPDDLRRAAERLAALIDQDGPVPDDADRARRRGLWIGKQGVDGMTPIRGNLSPEALATWEAIAAKWAAPGMCNPNDPAPCVTATPSQDQIDGDARSVGQRHHDALIAVGRSVLSSGELGQHNGLPVTIIVRTTLQDLHNAAGVGVTGGGTVLPIGDVLRLARHAHHYLAVFDKHTNQALNLLRSRRTASPAQRIMLIARDGGCTKPGCPVGAYGSQAHHATLDWSRGGNTNVDDLALACGPDNRMVGPGGWTTTIINGDVEWTPPPHLDTGQARTNTYHHPERLLAPPDDESKERDP